MDGWVVTRDAPALDRRWHKTWPPDVKAEHKRGHYQRTDEVEDGVYEVWWWVKH